MEYKNRAYPKTKDAATLLKDLKEQVAELKEKAEHADVVVKLKRPAPSVFAKLKKKDKK